jgi:hypothetical protein
MGQPKWMLRMYYKTIYDSWNLNLNEDQKNFYINSIFTFLLLISIIKMERLPSNKRSYYSAHKIGPGRISLGDSCGMYKL